MSKQKFLERYSRQIILKDIGILGQKLISKAKILVVGAGGLGCPIAEYLSRAGIGTLGIVDFDKVQLSNIHRQSMYNTKDIGKFKVDVVQKKIKLINPLVKIKKIRKKINEKNIKNIVSKFDIIVDGSDNFKTKFLLNKYSIKFKKFYISGAISKFDGHIFTFNFKTSFKSELIILFSLKLSLNEGRENVSIIFPPIYGNLDLAISKTLLAPLVPGDVANSSIGISDHSLLSFTDIQSNKFLKAAV